MYTILSKIKIMFHPCSNSLRRRDTVTTYISVFLLVPWMGRTPIPNPSPKEFSLWGTCMFFNLYVFLRGHVYICFSYTLQGGTQVWYSVSKFEKWKTPPSPIFYISFFTLCENTFMLNVCFSSTLGFLYHHSPLGICIIGGGVILQNCIFICLCEKVIYKFIN